MCSQQAMVRKITKPSTRLVSVVLDTDVVTATAGCVLPHFAPDIASSILFTGMSAHIVASIVYVLKLLRSWVSIYYQVRAALEELRENV